MNTKINIFKTFKLTWWQAAFFKLTTIPVGIIIGLLFPEILSPFFYLIVAVFIVSCLITIYYWYKQ